MDVEAYASKVLSMRQRVEEQLRPSVKQIAEWFIRGLKPECHAAVNTKNVETQEDFDELIEEAKMAERRASERTKRRAKKKKSSSDEESNSSSSEETGSDTDDQKKKHKKRNKLKKNDVLGEVQALVEELKKTKKGKDFRKNMFCSQCKQEGHIKEECTTTPTCAICLMYNHSTANCRYNMKNRAATVNQVDTLNEQHQSSAEAEGVEDSEGKEDQEERNFGRRKTLPATTATCRGTLAETAHYEQDI